MKPFNLEEAKAGKPVVTRDGRDVEILKFDLRGGNSILAIIKNETHDSVATYAESGNFHNPMYEDKYDLFMKSEIKVGYIVLEHDDAYLTGASPMTCVYETIESACEVANRSKNRTVSKITWEA